MIGSANVILTATVVVPAIACGAKASDAVSAMVMLAIGRDRLICHFSLLGDCWADQQPTDSQAVHVMGLPGLHTRLRVTSAPDRRFASLEIETLAARNDRVNRGHRIPQQSA
jgi:hypothetical protein